MNTTCLIIADANNLQHYFSYDTQPTLWQAIPAFEEILTAWEVKRDLPKFALYKNAINCDLQKIAKYYNKFDYKPVYILVLGMLFELSFIFYLLIRSKFYIHTSSYHT